MNKERRKQIEKAEALLQEAKELLEQAGEEEQEFFDNMPEGLQARLIEARLLIQELDEHEGVEGWSSGMRERIDQFLATSQ